jgi:hypothetical protein
MALIAPTVTVLFEDVELELVGSIFDADLDWDDPSLRDDTWSADRYTVLEEDEVVATLVTAAHEPLVLEEDAA